MRKLKALLLSQNVNAYTDLLGPLATEGITTDMALLKADIKSLSRKTGIACQLLRALQQNVIRMTTASETDLKVQNTCTQFSTGYAALDSVLYGGFEFGQIIEIYGCTEKSKFVLRTMESFLNEYPKAVVHHIDTLGTFQPRQIGDQSQQMMARIHCYEAFTASELHQLLEQISALHTVNNVKKTTMTTTTDEEPSSFFSASLIVINGLANLISPADWDHHHHHRGGGSTTSSSSKVSDMLNAMASVRKLMSLSILVLRTAQTSDEWTSGGNSNSSSGSGTSNNNATGVVLVWDSCVDLRVHLQQTPLPPPAPTKATTTTTPSLSSNTNVKHYYQCDIVKARVPVADTRAFVTEL